MAKFLLALVFFSTLLYDNNASKILVAFFSPGISHGITGNAFVEPLLNAGHEVTYITPYPRKDPPPNLHQIPLSYPERYLFSKFMNIEQVLEKKQDVADVSGIITIMYEIAEIFLKHEAVQKLIEDPKQTFDLVIVEWLYADALAGFGAVFQCPFIWTNSMGPHWMIMRLVDETPNPAYLPDINSPNVTPFTFTQRVEELWMQIKISVLEALIQPKFDSLYEDIFVAAGKKKGIIIPSLQEVQYNASFVFSNTHASLGEPIRLPQNFIQLGGLHVDPIPKPLPEDLKKIMDNAKNGVIYFSMGSNLQSKEMPDKMKREFLDMFGQLKQTVLWKFEEALPDVPKNVHILKWAPQQSILGHPNCVLFISHGGLLSTTETIHFGVPVIGIPVFIDQFINVDRAVKRGFAKKVDLSYDTPKELKTAIQDILSDPSFREKVKYLSLVYHDRPVAPRTEMVHWAEHAIKTRGAPHFRSRALQLSWYQKMYLDLAALVIAIILGFCFTIKYLCKSRQKTSSRKKFD